jgi:TetR/AcrR family transcriptional repressor of nem operon
VGRKLEFDYDRALNRATRLFWAKGYSNTSLRDLLKTMGIRESSFYNIAGSKKALYLEALKHYNDSVTRRRLEAFGSERSVRKGVRKFFETVLDELDDPKTPRVCLMAGSLATDVLEEPEFNRYVLGEMRLFEKVLVDRLAAARKAGELPGTFKPDVAAQVIVTYLQGLFRVVRVLKDRREMERQIKALLSGLGL